jgi:hypothetical protein
MPNFVEKRNVLSNTIATLVAKHFFASAISGTIARISMKEDIFIHVLVENIFHTRAL